MTTRRHAGSASVCHVPHRRNRIGRRKGLRERLAELEAAGLITLADKGYQGSTYAKIPYRGKNKPESREAGQPRPRETPRTRRARERPAQDLENPPEAPQLPLARRPARQGQLTRGGHCGRSFISRSTRGPRPLGQTDSPSSRHFAPTASRAMSLDVDHHRWPQRHTALVD